MDDDEGDDALSSNDPCSSPDDVFSKDPPPDLSRGGVSVFFEVVCLISLCRLREMKVFDEAVLLEDGTGGPCPYRCPLKLLEVVLALSFRPGA